MRELKTKDLGKASRILKKMGIKLSGTTQQEVGSNFVMSILENYHLAEAEVAELMADLIGNGMTAEGFLDLDLEGTIGYFKEFTELKSVGPFYNMLRATST